MKHFWYFCYIELSWKIVNKRPKKDFLFLAQSNGPIEANDKIGDKLNILKKSD